MTDYTLTDDDTASGIGQMPGTNQLPEVLIDWFDGSRFDFLSNFHPSPLMLPERVYRALGIDAVADRAKEIAASVQFKNGEAAFQAFKAADIDGFLDIAESRDPGEAKFLGRKCKMRSDWNDVKVDVMRETLRAKFSPQNPHLVERLLATGYAELVEGNTWGDAVWGRPLGEYRFAGTQKGENLLGQLLMQRRSELRLGHA